MIVGLLVIAATAIALAAYVAVFIHTKRAARTPGNGSADSPNSKGA